MESSDESVIRLSTGQWALLGFVGLIVFPVSFSFLSHFSFEEFSELLGSERFQLIFFRTLRQASISTAGCLILGLPGAWLYAQHKSALSVPGIQTMLRVFSIIPFCVPPIVFVFCVVLVFGNNGLINRWLALPKISFLYSQWSIIGVHVIYDFGICVRFVGQALRESIFGHVHSSRILGASRLQSFFTVLLPLIVPSVAHAASVTFLFCFTSFVIVMSLGSGPRDISLEVMIYEAIRNGYDITRASALGAVQLVVGFVIIGSYSMALRKNIPIQRYSMTLRKDSMIHLGLWQWGFALLFVVLFGGSALAFILRIFGKGPNLFGSNLIAIVPILRSLGKSLLIGGSTAMFCGFLSTLLCSIGIQRSRLYRSVMNSWASIPLAISPLMITLSLITIFPRNIPGTVLVVLVHCGLSLPFIVPICMQYIQNIQENLVQAPRNLGANWVQSFFHVRLPQARSPIWASASMGMLLSIGEFNAAFYLGARERVPTLSVYLYQSIGRYRFEEGMVAMLLLVLFVVLFTSFVERFRSRGSRISAYVQYKANSLT